MENSIIKGKRVFVSGANGFVGSNLCNRLVEENANVVAFMRKTVSGTTININPLKNRIQIKYGDVRDLKTLIDATKDIDIFFHLAAQSHIPDSVEDPSGSFTINAMGTQNCLEAARIDDVDLFIFAGSDKIYGDPLYLPLDEKHTANPRSPYDASKLAGEALCIAYYKTYGLKVCLPRFSNIYGPRQDRRKAVPDFISKLLKNERPVIRSDGSLVRDYLYVGDVVDGYLKLLGKRKAVGEIINFGTGKGVTVLDLCNLLIEVSGVDQKPVILRQRTPGEIPIEYLDISKAKKLLGWSPKFSLHEGLSLTWKWYKNSQDFLWR